MPHEDPAVTVDVLQRVKPGHTAAFEATLSELVGACRRCEGHLGVNVYRPVDEHDSSYRIVFKFARLSQLRRWEVSPLRLALLARLAEHTVVPPQISVLSGLETWFTLPRQPGVPPPPRHKMVVITTLTIFLLINLVSLALSPLVRELHPLLRTLLVTATTVTLMTYLVMPRMTRLFRRWLYPRA